jgi:hypothetical protein
MTEHEIMNKLEEQRRFAILISNIIDTIARVEFNSIFMQCGFDLPTVSDEMLENLSILGFEKTVSDTETKEFIYKKTNSASGSNRK